MTIEELEVGDKIWVQKYDFDSEYSPATFVGNNIARIQGYYMDLQGVKWLFRRKPLWKILKNFIFNK